MLLLFPLPAQSQQRFAIDLGLGQSTGLTSYQRDVVTTTATAEPDPSLSGRSLSQPYLADERNSWGSHLAIRFHVNALHLGLSTQRHARDAYLLHHRGEPLISDVKQRPDGTYDDSGLQYTPLDQTERVTARQRNRGDLLIASLMAGWSFTPLDLDPFTLSLPISAGLTLAHITEPARPFVFGLRFQTGAQASYRFADNFALTSGLYLSPLLTAQYKNRDDAARRAALRPLSTFHAITSSMVQATFEVGLTFIVR